MIFRNRFAIAVFTGVLTVSTAVFSQGGISETTDQNAAIAEQSTVESSKFLPQVVADSPNDLSQQQKVDSTQIVQPSIESTVAQQVSSDSNKIAAIQEKSATKNKTHLMGIGVDLGLQFFAPAEINDFLEEVYEDLKDGYYYIDFGTPRMFLGYNVGGHVMVRPIPWMAFGGIGRYFFATKKLAVSSDGSVRDAYNNPDFTAKVMDGIVGGKVEAYFNPAKTVSFKGGFSVEAHFATVELEQSHTVTLKGNGVGITPYAGISITPGRGIVMINVDFMIPICKIDLDEVEGKFDRISDSHTYDDYNQPYPLPKELNMTGLIIKPSVTICFP